MPTSPRPRVFGLDALRAFAILCVVVSHARFLLVPGHPIASRPTMAGFLGVEVFFVLSGFLIGRILLGYGDTLGQVAALRHFWRRRWYRTLPNYALFLGVNFGLVGLALLPAPQHPIPYFTFTQNWFHVSEWFFRESWSLALEEWFYVLAPLALAGLLALRVRRGPALVAVLVAGLVLPTALRVLVVTGPGGSWDLTRTVVPLHLDAPMMGVLAAAIATYQPGTWARWRRPAAIAGSFMLVAATMLFDGATVDRSVFLRTLHPNLSQVGTALLLPALATWERAEGSLGRATGAIALWSYAWYLTNLPVLAVISALADPLAYSPAQASLAVLAFFALSLGLAALVYHWWERPWMDLRERMPAARRRASAP